MPEREKSERAFGVKEKCRICGPPQAGNPAEPDSLFYHRIRVLKGCEKSFYWQFAQIHANAAPNVPGGSPCIWRKLPVADSVS